MALEGKTDLLVIGGGSGGVRAARLAAESGKRVVLVEQSAMGGTCVNLGCIPKKLFAYAAAYGKSFPEAACYGWEGTAPDLNWGRMMHAKNAEISRLNSIYERNLKQAGAHILRGTAKLVKGESFRVEVTTRESGKKLSWSVGGPSSEAKVPGMWAEKVLLATGAWPAIPEGLPGRELAETSNELFFWPEVPTNVAVVGGGYIAIEMATILAGMGSCVTLIHRGDRVLRGFDQGIRSHLTQAIQEAGINLKLNLTVTEIEHSKAGSSQQLDVHLSDGVEMQVDKVLYATGRQPNLPPMTDSLHREQYSKEEFGIKTDEDQKISLNDMYMTSISGVYALGDLVGGPQLTPYAIAQAVDFCAAHGYGGERRKIAMVPTAVFCSPNIGTVGLTENEAAIKGSARVFEARFRSLKDSLTENKTEVLIKLVVEGEEGDGRVLGAHMVGEHAGEVIQCLTPAVQTGMMKSQWDQTLPVHPTTSEEFFTLRNSRLARLEG